jgi:rhodanese-related sulfurtransferase
MYIGKLRALLIFLFFVLFVVAAQGQQQPPNMITAEELKAKMANNQPVTIIDVRSAEGFANSGTTVKGSIHYKLRKLKYRLQYPPFKNLPRDSEIVTYCACPKDESSISAAQILQDSGFTRVRVLQGGWTEWVKANGPVQPRAKN